MTLSTRLSFEDQKNEVKLQTQSAEKWIRIGKWAVPSGAIYFHRVVVVLFVPEFSPQRGRFRSSGKINSGT